MLPDYKSFKADLNAYRYNIMTLKTSFMNAVKADGLTGEAEETYKWLNDKLNNILITIDDILDENKKHDKESDSISWSVLVGLANDTCPPSFQSDRIDSDAENAENISRKIDNGKMSAMYVVSRRLTEFRMNISRMTAKHEYNEYNKQIIEIAKSRQKYYEILDSFKLGEDYEKSYEQLLEERSKLKPELETAQANANECEKTAGEARKAYYETLTTEGGIIYKLENEARQHQEEIANLNKQIAENRMLVEKYEYWKDIETFRTVEIKDELAAQKKVCDELVSQVNDISNKVSDFAQKRDESEMECQNLKRLMFRIEHPQNDPKAPKDTAEAAVREVAGRYVRYLRIQMDIEDFIERYNEKIKSLGVDPADRDGVMQMFNLGRTLEGMRAGEEARKAKNGAITMAIKDNLPNITRPIELYTSMKTFIDELKDIYGASENMRNEMDERIKNPFDLIHLAHKAIADCKNKADDMYLGRVEDEKLAKFNLSTKDLTQRFNDVISNFNKLKVSRSEYDKLSSALDAARKEREELEVKLDEQNMLYKDTEDLLRHERHEDDIKQLREMEPELLKAMKEHGDRIAEIDKELNPHREKLEVFEKTKLSTAGAAGETRDRYEKLANIAKNLDEKINKFKLARDQHDLLAKQTEALKKQFGFSYTNVIENDIWVERRNLMFEKAREFVRTADFGKRSGHENSTEFKWMVDAVKDLYTYKEKNDRFALGEIPDKPELQSVAVLKKKLYTMRDAANHYIAEKKKYPHPISRQQRRLRLDYAGSIVRFADNCLNQLKEMSAMKDSLNKDIQAVEVNRISLDRDSDAVRFDINRAIREKRQGIEPVRPDVGGFVSEKKNARNELVDDVVVIDAADVKSIAMEMQAENQQPADPQPENPVIG